MPRPHSGPTSLLIRGATLSYLGVMVVLPLGLYLPTHLVLRKVFAPREAVPGPLP